MFRKCVFIIGHFYLLNAIVLPMLSSSQSKIRSDSFFEHRDFISPEK